MKIRNIKVNFKRLPDGGYCIIITALPEIEAVANDLKSAKKKAKDIIDKYYLEIDSTENKVEHTDLNYEATRTFRSFNFGKILSSKPTAKNKKYD